VSLETGVSNYGKTEACPAGLVASLATPEEKLAPRRICRSQTRSHFANSYPATPSSIDPNMQQPRPEMG
jgi:hypothetical protein